MSTRLLIVVAVSSLMLSAILLAGSLGLSASADAYSVATSAYKIGSVTASPDSAQIGSPIALNGTGQLPKSDIEILMGGKNIYDGKTYMIDLGKTSTDGLGNWTFCFTVPATCTRLDDNTTQPVLPGQWPVGSQAFGTDGAYYDQYTDLSVVEAASNDPGGDPGSGSGTPLYGSTLPETGLPLVGAMMAAVGAASLMGAGLQLRRQRRADRLP